MKKFLKSLRYGEKGFTLIELLIVIAILGVISAAVIPNVVRFTQSGKKAAAMQEMETFQTAVDAGMADAAMTGVVSPTTLGPGVPADETWTLTDGSASCNVDEFLRRHVGGQWTVGPDGLISAGRYKAPPATSYWQYNSGTWTWVPSP